jgi:myotubularin-related protein 6/7/8
MIWQCTLRPSSVGGVSASIRLRCRDFTFLNFILTQNAIAKDFYFALKALTCQLSGIDRLYAFSYIARPPESEVNGWKLYSPEAEWARLGVGQGPNPGWRVSRINVDYKVSSEVLFKQQVRADLV